MNLPARWRTSVLASSLHAARCVVARRPLVDSPSAETLRPCAERVASELAIDGTDVSAAGVRWRVAIDLAADDPTPVEFAARCAARLAPSSPVAISPSRLAGAIDSLQRQVAALLPRLSVELPLRVGPLREQWEARGPGLLSYAARITGIPLRSLAADALVLHPWCGGFGETYEGPEGAEGGVGIEGVLINACEQLPETVRLGWLFLRLAAADVLAEVPARPLDSFVAAVTIPPIIAAGQFVELVPPGQTHVADAFQRWLPAGLPASIHARLAEQEVAPGLDWLDEAAELAAAWSKS